MNNHEAQVHLIFSISVFFSWLEIKKPADASNFEGFVKLFWSKSNGWIPSYDQKYQPTSTNSRWPSHGLISPVRSITLWAEWLLKRILLCESLNYCIPRPGPGEIWRYVINFRQIWGCSSNIWGNFDHGQLGELSKCLRFWWHEFCDTKIVGSIFSISETIFITRNKNQQTRLIS